MTKRLKFRVPLVPTSSKNSRQLAVTKRGRPVSLPSTKARRHKQVVKGSAVQAMLEAGLVSFGDDEVGVRVRHLVTEKQIEVEIWRIGPKPATPNGRGRDIDNLASTVLDAMNRTIYDDDRCVGLLQVERVVG